MYAMIDGFSKLSIAISESIQAMNELSSEIKAHRSRYTSVGWFLYRLGFI